MKVSTHQYEKGVGWNRTPEIDPGSESSTLILLFAAPSQIEKTNVIAELETAYPRAVIIGCSTAGEIVDGEIYRESLAMSVIQLDKTRLKCVTHTIIDAEESRQTGKAIGKDLMADDLKAVLVFSDGLHTNGSEFSKGLNESLPGKIVIAGGLAADSDRFNKTYVIVNGEYKTHAAVAVGLYGDSLKVGTGARGGWDIFGLERTITRSEGNTVYEMDGKPALELYENYLGDVANELPAAGLLFPISLQRGKDEETVVRTIVGIDRDKQALVFAGDMPEGSKTQLMQASRERLVNGAELAAESARDQLGDTPPQFGMVVSCFGRRLVLQERTDEELEAVKNALGAGSHQIGYYSYGELSPSGKLNCELHNQTLTLLVMAES